MHNEEIWFLRIRDDIGDLPENPDHLWLKRKRQWNWLGILHTYRCIHWLDFCFEAEWMRSVLISTSFSSLVCSWLASRCSQRRPSQQRIPWALQLKEQITDNRVFFKKPFRPCPSGCGHAPSTAAPGARPQSACRRGQPPASSRAAAPQAKSTPRPARRASRRRVAPPASQPGPKSSRKSTKRSWRGPPGDVGIFSFLGDGKNSTAHSPSGGPGGESSVSFCFCSATGPRDSGTHFSKERAISFSSFS